MLVAGFWLSLSMLSCADLGKGTKAGIPRETGASRLVLCTSAETKRLGATAFVTADAGVNLGKTRTSRANDLHARGSPRTDCSCRRTFDLCCISQHRRRLARAEVRSKPLPTIELAGGGGPLKRAGLARIRRPRAALLRVSAAAGLVAAVTATGTGAANAAVIGPDVSSHNHDNGATLNWNAIRGAGGASFVFIKATEGGGYRNPRFTSDFASARRHSLIRGAYHFARPGGGTNGEITRNATAEAVQFGHAIGSLSGPGNLAPVLDLEDAGTLNPSQMSLWTHTWLKRMTKLTGRTPILYTNVSFWRDGELGRLCPLPTVAGQLRSLQARRGRRLEELHVLAVHRNGEAGRRGSQDGLECVQRVVGPARSDDHDGGVAGSSSSGASSSSSGGSRRDDAQIHHTGHHEAGGCDAGCCDQLTLRPAFMAGRLWYGWKPYHRRSLTKDGQGRFSTLVRGQSYAPEVDGEAAPAPIARPGS